MAPKRDERKKREAERAMARELDDESESASLARLSQGLSNRPAIDNGAEELFEKKLSKEEKKELAAKKKAEREARKAAAAQAGAADDNDDNVDKVPSTAAVAAAGGKAKPAKAKPETKAERVQREQAELETELEAARVEAVRRRNLEGAHLGQIEAPEFSLPNPGGGPDLLTRNS